MATALLLLSLLLSLLARGETTALLPNTTVFSTPDEATSFRFDTETKCARIGHELGVCTLEALETDDTVYQQGICGDEAKPQLRAGAALFGRDECLRTAVEALGCHVQSAPDCEAAPDQHYNLIPLWSLWSLFMPHNDFDWDLRVTESNEQRSVVQRAIRATGKWFSTTAVGWPGGVHMSLGHAIKVWMKEQEPYLQPKYTFILRDAKTGELIDDPELLAELKAKRRAEDEALDATAGAAQRAALDKKAADAKLLRDLKKKKQASEL